jgi:hypothetical protein
MKEIIIIIKDGEILIFGDIDLNLEEYGIEIKEKEVVFCG